MSSALLMPPSCKWEPWSSGGSIWVGEAPPLTSPLTLDCEAGLREDVNKGSHSLGDRLGADWYRRRSELNGAWGRLEEAVWWGRWDLPPNRDGADRLRTWFLPKGWWGRRCVGIAPAERLVERCCWHWRPTLCSWLGKRLVDEDHFLLRAERPRRLVIRLRWSCTLGRQDWRCTDLLRLVLQPGCCAPRCTCCFVESSAGVCVPKSLGRLGDLGEVSLPCLFCSLVGGRIGMMSCASLWVSADPTPPAPSSDWREQAIS